MALSFDVEFGVSVFVLLMIAVILHQMREHKGLLIDALKRILWAHAVFFLFHLVFAIGLLVDKGVDNVEAYTTLHQVVAILSLVAVYNLSVILSSHIHGALNKIRRRARVH
jgi:hypothetical protein